MYRPQVKTQTSYQTLRGSSCDQSCNDRNRWLSLVALVFAGERGLSALSEFCGRSVGSSRRGPSYGQKGGGEAMAAGAILYLFSLSVLLYRTIEILLGIPLDILVLVA